MDVREQYCRENLKRSYDKLTRSVPKGRNDNRCQCYICQEVKSDKNLRHLPNYSPKKMSKSADNPKNPSKSKPVSQLAKSKDVKENVARSLLHDMAPNKDGDIAIKTGERRLRDRPRTRRPTS